VLELALGVLLVSASRRVWRGSAPPDSDGGGGRTQALLDRLARITPAAAFPVGALLGIGGPKRFTISVVAASAISAADLTTRQSLSTAALYVAVASVLVWAPIVLYLVAGRRARAWLAQGEAWLAATQRLFAAATLLVLGALLVADGLLQLL
jgi:hypothetical protein